MYSADVKSFASINKAIEAAVSESGIVELLVLSHGVSVPGTFEERSLEEMDHMIDTNLRGNIHAIKAALPHIKSSKGAPASIAIFSSQAGQVWTPLSLFDFFVDRLHAFSNFYKIMWS